MTGRAKGVDSKVDRLMEEASEALAAGRYIDCERTAVEALHHAHRAGDYERMARILLPLQEARRQRRQQAADVKKVARIRSYSELEALLTGAKPIKPGCYLLEPPLVGVDGRELREKALADGVPVFVLVREPLTKLGQWPIVEVGPVTVRTRVAPPKRIDVAWMMRAGEVLGDSALATVDPLEGPADRVDHLMDLLSAVVDHEKLHQALEEACRAAHAEAVVNPRKADRSGSRKRAVLDDDLPDDIPLDLDE